MVLRRLQWLTLWDETREFFYSSPRVKRWDKEQIIAKMDELERNFVRKLEEEFFRDHEKFT